MWETQRAKADCACLQQADYVCLQQECEAVETVDREDTDLVVSDFRSFPPDWETYQIASLLSDSGSC